MRCIIYNLMLTSKYGKQKSLLLYMGEETLNATGED